MVKTWKILPNAGENSIYDFAFDPDNQNIVYMVNGSMHDFPFRELTAVGSGGVFKSTNKGDSWTRLTPSDDTFKRQYLSVAYDKARNHIYAGSHSDGISRSTDGGQSWHKFNAGLPSTIEGHDYPLDLVIPQIEIDNNGNVYALVSGVRPEFSQAEVAQYELPDDEVIIDNSGATKKYFSWVNNARTGIYRLNVVQGNETWTLLRGDIDLSSHQSWDPKHQPWKRPISFALDPNNSNVLWLTDIEEKTLQRGASGVWKIRRPRSNLVICITTYLCA